MKRFLIIFEVLLFSLAMRAQSVTYTCRYWFDQNDVQTTTFSSSIWQAELDIGSLADGLHTLHIHVMDTSMKWSAPQNYLFLKTTYTQQENCVYHCWFDEDFANKQTDSLGNGSFLMDVSGIEEGLHTLNVILQGSSLTATQSYLFMRVEMLEVNGVDMSNLTYHCWFDEDFEHQQTDSLRDGNFLLDVTNLSNGLHSVSVMLEGGMGTLTPRKCYFFYKIPFGGNGLNKWEYCVNGDWANRITTNIVPSVDTLSIVSLLPVPTQTIRSSCFHFHPNGDEPYLNAKNEITLRFWTADDHFIDKSAFYIDEYVSEPIQTDDLEYNATANIPAPRDNQMQWYKVPLVVGDSIAFKTDKACTVQLFAPSGEEVYAATASEALVFGGIHAWEDGDYYLVVHDVTGSGDEICLTNVYIHKFAILAYDVHLVGNGGCSTITFQGNGFNSLLDVYLLNAQNDTIHRLDIGHESNTTTTVTFDFYHKNLGAYDAVFQFYGETIRVNGALEVQEPVDILLTSSVSYPSRFLRNTPCTYTYTITNNGNMSAYGVPIFAFISSATDGISHIEFEGIGLKSLADYIDFDSISPDMVSEIKLFSESIGDDSHFIKIPAIDERTGDSVVVRSNYFVLNLAPYEVRTLKLIITSSETISVWLTVPNEIIPPLNSVSNRQSTFCCIRDKFECVFNILGDVSGLVSDVAPEGTSVANIAKITACVSNLISNLSSSVGVVMCREGGAVNFLGALTECSFSWTNSIVNCFEKFFRLQGMIVNLTELLTSIKAKTATMLLDAGNCVLAFTQKKPGCPDGDDEGGESEAVNSLDPNDIYGYLSESGSHYMRQEIQNIHYEIEFENDTTLATAAAHTIIVRDTLDASKFDLNSLAARSVTIGDKRLELNGEQTFARTLDLRPEIYVIAQIEQDYDPTTGIIQWTIQSLDPMTMEPTDDPNQGVLPVNYYGNGVGFIDYSIDIKEAFADGTEISNRAGIIFDQEDIIMTPIWTNTVDAVKPNSHIEEVIPNADTLNFIFASEDNRSGVWYHTVYYRNASTEMEWKVKKTQIFENNYLLVNDELMTTEFLVMATDSAGNREEKEMLAEYIFVYDGPGQVTQADALAQGWNWWSTYIEQNGQDGLADLENSLGHNGLTIKSQSDFTDNFYQDMGVDYWYGSLESVQNEQGYLINVAQPCNTSLTGIATNPTNHPITIRPNWNWIGYPVASPQAVTSALVSFTPSPDDVLKGQSDFTSYYEGYGWYPDDFTLVPGQSYLYCSNATVNKTLTYSGVSRGGVMKLTKTEKRYWNNNVHAYADNFNVIAVVNIDGEEQRGENLELGAFVNGECRGSARLRYFALLDRYYAMLTITGQEDDKVEFRLIDTENLYREEIGLNQLVFKKNTVVGRLGKPYEIYFGDNDMISDNMVMYPNPVERGHEFSLDIPHDETIIEIVITDVLGTQVRHEAGAVNAKSVKGLLAAGVYVIKAVAKSGTTYHGRLIVE